MEKIECEREEDIFDELKLEYKKADERDIWLRYIIIMINK